MGSIAIRPAGEADAPGWLDLLTSVLGEDYPDKQVYDPSWIRTQLQPDSAVETWVAEAGNSLQASIAFLAFCPENVNPITNLGYLLMRPDPEGKEAAEALLSRVAARVDDRQQITIGRVLASDNAAQLLFEKNGYACAGFQPYKHMKSIREGTLFYVRLARNGLPARQPLSESLPQVNELAAAVLANLGLPNPPPARDGALGYPLQTEITFHEAGAEDFELWRLQAQTANPPVEISGTFNLGAGLLRTEVKESLRAILSQRDDKITGGLLYFVDPYDRCLRLVDSFSMDDLSMGALCREAVRIGHEQYAVVYVEIDILATAPRLLKSLEQLGFVPVAYLPAFHYRQDVVLDIIKMVKLNIAYSLENVSLTTSAQAIAETVDRSFQDQKLGVAIINLLRGLPIFNGLGDGELRKIARLFAQKLYRPGERIFSKGDQGNEAYVVMRGQIDIVLEENTPPIASIGNGQIFGELAFLDGAPRVAIATAVQPSILLVVQRSAFNTLAQREPHLGMVVMRNIAMELSNRLRKANAAITSGKH